MKALVIEDSRLAREGLVRMLGEFPAIEVVGAAEQPDAALALIAEHQPEVLFLDIHLPGGSGFDLLGQLDYTPRIIFTTAYAEFAIRSFEFNTVDYLLKPISPERLAMAIAKLGAVEAKQDDGDRLSMNSRIFIKDGEKCHLLPLANIRYLESCKNYVQVYFDQQWAYVKKSLNSIEARLPPEVFFRISRQHVVNLQKVSGIEETMSFGYKAVLDDGKSLEISRRNLLELKEKLSF
ncbi:LytR/AlgR family response regulator transcription factor [Chitinimonas sp.]|uniref:LytR/AlgR family response regulator transcription factor n=1 Tax=Chitinimonas sp. TaxID=1934313 RepID=UPI0035B0C022